MHNNLPCFRLLANHTLLSESSIPESVVCLAGVEGPLQSEGRMHCGNCACDWRNCIAETRDNSLKLRVSVISLSVHAELRETSGYFTVACSCWRHARNSLHVTELHARARVQGEASHKHAYLTTTIDGCNGTSAGNQFELYFRVQEKFESLDIWKQVEYAMRWAFFCMALRVQYVMLSWIGVKVPCLCLHNRCCAQMYGMPHIGPYWLFDGNGLHVHIEYCICVADGGSRSGKGALLNTHRSTACGFQNEY